MNDIDKKVRRFLLKPLARRSLIHREESYPGALKNLDERALGEIFFESQRDITLGDGPLKPDIDAKPQRAKQMVGLANALYASRRISKSEHTFYVALSLEGIHEDNYRTGKYDSELNSVRRSIEQIEREHGLKEGEYWRRGEGPKEYDRLNRKFSDILDNAFSDLLREFGLLELKALWDGDREEYNRLRERGRRSVIHKDEYECATRDALVQLELEAQRAAEAGAFTAAIVTLGAAAEGLLLLRCLRSRTKSTRYAAKLPKHLRPHASAEPGTWRFETLIETCLAAGWLRRVETEVAVYDIAGLAHSIRLMRNFVHPGKHAKDRPWVLTGEREYRDAKASYTVLVDSLG